MFISWKQTINKTFTLNNYIFYFNSQKVNRKYDYLGIIARSAPLPGDIYYLFPLVFYNYKNLYTINYRYTRYLWYPFHSDVIVCGYNVVINNLPYSFIISHSNYWNTFKVNLPIICMVNHPVTDPKYYTYLTSQHVYHITPYKGLKFIGYKELDRLVHSNEFITRFTNYILKDIWYNNFSFSYLLSVNTVIYNIFTDYLDQIHNSWWSKRKFWLRKRYNRKNPLTPPDLKDCVRIPAFAFSYSSVELYNLLSRSLHNGYLEFRAWLNEVNLELNPDQLSNSPLNLWDSIPFGKDDLDLVSRRAQPNPSEITYQYPLLEPYQSNALPGRPTTKYKYRIAQPFRASPMGNSVPLYKELPSPYHYNPYDCFNNKTDFPSFKYTVSYSTDISLHHMIISWAIPSDFKHLSESHEIDPLSDNFETIPYGSKYFNLDTLNPLYYFRLFMITLIVSDEVYSDIGANVDLDDVDYFNITDDCLSDRLKIEVSRPNLRSYSWLEEDSKREDKGYTMDLPTIISEFPKLESVRQLDFSKFSWGSGVGRYWWTLRQSRININEWLDYRLRLRYRWIYNLTAPYDITYSSNGIIDYLDCYKNENLGPPNWSKDEGENGFTNCWEGGPIWVNIPLIKFNVYKSEYEYNQLLFPSLKNIGEDYKWEWSPKTLLRTEYDFDYNFCRHDWPHNQTINKTMNYPYYEDFWHQILDKYITPVYPKPWRRHPTWVEYHSIWEGHLKWHPFARFSRYSKDYYHLNGIMEIKRVESKSGLWDSNIVRDKDRGIQGAIEAKRRTTYTSLTPVPTEKVYEEGWYIHQRDIFIRRPLKIRTLKTKKKV